MNPSMKDHHEHLHWVWSFVIPYVVLAFVVKVAIHLWWIPRTIGNHYLKQGVKGPKYQFLLGNLKELAGLNLRASKQPMINFSHNILPRVLTFYHHWRKIYGSMYIIWFGTTARVTVSDPSLIREIFITKAEYFEKTESPAVVKEVEGDGLLNLKGDKWALHRRIINPLFHLENLKMMVGIMGKSMEETVGKLSSEMSNSGRVKIEVSQWFEGVTEDAIIRAVFGSRSYEAGKAIFKLQSQQVTQAATAYSTILIPGYRFLPTKKNMIMAKLEKEVGKSIVGLIEERMKATSCHQDAPDECPSDLLGLMINVKRNNNELSPFLTTNDILEECKTLLFAGKPTTSNLMTWTTILLAMNPHWQEQAREEVYRVCGAHEAPTKDDFTKLKTLGIIINESLRLYPPVVATIRRATKDLRLGEVNILRGTEVLIPILAVHHDANIWSYDVHEFNPARFAKGIAHAAKHPMAFMPFGMGSRRCIGQNLAILQAKLAIAMILQRFSLELSPTYQHAPAVQLMLYPQHGAPIVFKKL